MTRSPRRVATLAIGCCRGAVLLLGAQLARADVVFDGSLGPTGTLAGTFEIPSSYGTQVGANLFHSFSRFDLANGESATFTTAFGGVTTNVIGRVTGGVLSTIDGTVASTIPGAGLWIMNPNGVVFGPNARLDVDGGFHATTADVLLFEDGSRLSATTGPGTSLTIANPAAFGFLDANVAPISVGPTTLEVGLGQRLALVGGDVTLSGTYLYTPNGAIDVASVGGAGTLSTGLVPTGIASFGNVRLTGAGIDTSDLSGGAIHIRAGQLLLENGSALLANTSGTAAGARGGDITIDVVGAAIQSGSQLSSTTFGVGNGGLIRVAAQGDVVIEGTVAGQPAGIFANVRAGAAGDGGRIEIDARNLRVDTGGLIGAVTFGPGDAGTIALDVEDTVTIRRGAGTNGAIFLNSLSSATGGVGNIEIDARRLLMLEGGVLQANTVNGAAGRVAIDVDVLEMSGGSQVTTGTFGPGAGGTLSVRARTASLRDVTAQGVPTGLFAGSTFPASGRGGDLVVDVGTLSIARGAQIASGTSGFGPSGAVTVTATDRITIDGEGLTFPRFTGIFNSTYGNATAGPVNVLAPTLDLRRGAFIQSGSFSNNPAAIGRGGTIHVAVDDLSIDGGFIEARTETSGRGGDLDIDVRNTMTLRNSTGFVFTPGFGQPIGGLLTSAGGIFNSPVATGSAGDIVVDAGTVVIRDGGVLTADTFLRGDAGSIVVNARTIDLFSDAVPFTGIFDSSATSGRAGAISLNARDITVAGRASVQAGAFGAGAAGAIGLAAERIAIQSGGSVSSSTVAGGTGGTVSLTASDSITVTTDGGVTASTAGSGRGGDVVVAAPRIRVTAEGSIAANATGTGNAGTIRADASDELAVNGGTITTSARQSAGGNIALNVGRMLFVDQGTISAAADGVTPQDSGGNVTIDPDFVVLRGGSILASANAGNGGNVDISSDAFVLDTNSRIDASSNLGLDGDVAIDSPHQVTGELVPVAPPAVGVTALASQRCSPRLAGERSSLTVEPLRTVAAPTHYVPTPIEPVTVPAVAAAAAAASVAADDSRSSGSCYEARP